VPDPSFLLFVDDAPDSIEAEKLLENKGIRFLAAKTDGLSASVTLPILLRGRERYVGIQEVRAFAESFIPSEDTKQIEHTLRMLDALKVRADMSSFDERLRLQKIVYLLEELGLQTDWRFSWYLRGPYSPSLAHELYRHGKLRVRGRQLTDGDMKVLEKFRKKFDPHATPVELEAAAAVLFIGESHRGRYDSASKLIDQVREEKPHLSRRLVSTYVETIYPNLEK